MGFYEAQVLPRAVHVLLGTPGMARIRRPALAGLSGTVVELGFGSGSNVGLYPPAVERVLAVEPNATARHLAGRRLERHPEPPVEWVGLDGARVPLPAATADAVLATFTLCTIPDLDAALGEARRLLRPGGAVHFLEHGLAPDPAVARRQRRLEPLQKRLGGGCHLTRDAPTALERAGFRLAELHRFRAGSAVLGTMSAGRAVRP